MAGGWMVDPAPRSHRCMALEVRLTSRYLPSRDRLMEMSVSPSGMYPSVPVSKSYTRTLRSLVLACGQAGGRAGGRAGGQAGTRSRSGPG